LIDSDSYRVEGYFEETKIPHIKLGADIGRRHKPGIVAILRDLQRLPQHANVVALQIQICTIA
jgi:hypothetical protein